MPKAHATNQYIEGAGEGYGEIFQSFKRSYEAGLNEVGVEEPGSCPARELRHKSF